MASHLYLQEEVQVHVGEDNPDDMDSGTAAQERHKKFKPSKKSVIRTEHVDIIKDTFWKQNSHLLGTSDSLDE